MPRQDFFFYKSSSQNWLQASNQCFTHTRAHTYSLEHYCDGLLFHAHSGVVVAAALTAAAQSLLTETDMGTCPRSFFPSKLLFTKHRFFCPD